METRAIFAGLSTPERERALGQLERLSFPQGAVVVAEGDEPDYVVQQGSVDVFVPDRAGTSGSAAGAPPASGRA